MASVAQSHQLVICHGKRASVGLLAEPGSLTTTIAQGTLTPNLRDMFIESIDLTQLADRVDALVANDHGGQSGVALGRAFRA
jgi:hypothetical protein